MEESRLASPDGGGICALTVRQSICT